MATRILTTPFTGIARFKVSKGISLYGDHAQTIIFRQVSLGVCVTACCAEGADVLCKAVAFDFSTLTCYIYNYTVETPGVNVINNDNMVYYELDTCGSKGLRSYDEYMRPIYTEKFGKLFRQIYFFNSPRYGINILPLVIMKSEFNKLLTFFSDMSLYEFAIRAAHTKDDIIER